MTVVAIVFFTVLAWLVFYLGWRKSSQSYVVLGCGLLAIAAHQLLSALNAIYGPFPFAELDAYSFHLHGIQRVEMPETNVWTIGSGIYKSMLASVYSVFGISLWLGQTFSIVFFGLAAAFFCLFASRLQLSDRSLAIALLVFGLLPSSLLYGSFTLRETFMTAFFILGAYAGFWAIQATNRRQQWILCFWALVAFLLMGLLHMVLLVYAIVASALLCFILYAQQASWQRATLQICALVAVVGILLLLMKEFLPVNLADNYFAMTRIQIEGKVVPIPHAISIYHQTANASGASTQYDAALEFTTWGRMLFVFAYSYIFYMGWPVTGDYAELSTWVIMLEAVFRLLGVIAMLLLARKNKQWYWLIMLYVSLTFLWNIGTSNHGQALRHHMMTEWILILALLSYLQNRFSLLLDADFKKEFTESLNKEQNGKQFKQDEFPNIK